MLLHTLTLLNSFQSSRMLEMRDSKFCLHFSSTTPRKMIREGSVGVERQTSKRKIKSENRIGLIGGLKRKYNLKRFSQCILMGKEAGQNQNVVIAPTHSAFLLFSPAHVIQSKMNVAGWFFLVHIEILRYNTSRNTHKDVTCYFILQKKYRCLHWPLLAKGEKGRVPTLAASFP